MGVDIICSFLVNTLQCDACAGTPLGDPIEFGALGHALNDKGRSLLQRDPVGVVSVKSCFGHTEGAAGLTGALLAMQCIMLGCRPMVSLVP